MKLPPAQILDITPDQYHKLPHLSSSLAKTIITKSPKHAKLDVGKSPSTKMDFGDVGHRLLLGKGKDYIPLNFDAYRSNDAKKARDEAYAAGKTPILLEAFERANMMAETLRVNLADQAGIVLDGESELVITWWEMSKHGPVQCRAMLDHVWRKTGVIFDLKTTENAAASAVERTAESLNYAISAAAYRRALVALNKSLAGREDFIFCFAETSDPFDFNLFRPDGMFREVGERRWLRAVEMWGECTATGVWPGYGAGVKPLTTPAWALNRELAAEDAA